MIVSFDVDCGEVLPGHRLVARGLSGPVLLALPEPVLADADDDDDDDDDPWLSEDVGPVEGYRSPERVTEDVAGAGGYPGFSLEYELVPGLREDQNFFEALVGIWYEADVPLPWEPGDHGALAPFEGGASTHGSRGAWPLPPDARVLTFTVRPPLDVEGQSLGQLRVQIDTAQATWMTAKAEGS